MKIIRRKERYHLSGYVFLPVIILILVISFMYDFSKQMNSQIGQIITDHLRDISIESSKAVEDEFRRIEEEVTFTAEYLADSKDFSDDKVDMLLNHLKKKCNFTTVLLVAEDGRLYSGRRKQLPLSAGGFTENILEGKSGITDLFRTNVSEKEACAVYAPVTRNGKILGGIVGIMMIDRMVDLVDSTGFNSHCYSYVLKTDGTVIMQTTHPEGLYKGRAYFYFLDNLTEECSVTSAELQEHMDRRERGMYTYTAQGQDRIAYYMPVNVNNWYVVTAVQSQVAVQYIEKINLIAVQLTIKVAAIFLLLAVMILCWSRKTTKIILNSKEKLEVGNQKLQLALANSSNPVFEYLVKEDTIRFIASAHRREKRPLEVLEHAADNIVSEGIVDPSYSAVYLQALENASLGNDTGIDEFLAGSSFEEDSWFKLILAPVHNAQGETVEVIGTMEDITEEKRIRRSYEQEEQYRAAILSEAVALWSVDLIREKMLTWSIKGNDQMSGSASKPYDREILRRFCNDLCPEDRERIWKFLQVSSLLTAYYTGQREIKELFRFKLSGEEEYRWVSCTINLLGEPITGNPIAFAYLKDVDEETKLARSSEQDPLTGLYNRRNIEKKVEEALAEKKGLACLMMMDLDGFKEVNDQFGHQEGDEVLKQTGKILEEAFRSDDLVARLGGDEFLVFLASLPDENCASQRAEDVRRKVCGMNSGGKFYDISISIGLVFAPKDGKDFQNLYKKADEALYQAKRAGRNRIRIYKNQ